MMSNIEITPVDENTGLSIGVRISPTLPPICQHVPIMPVLSAFSSGGLCSSWVSSFLRRELFFFPLDFFLPPPAPPPSSFFCNSATRSLANETCPSLAPFSIAPLIQLLFDHS